VKDRNFTCLIFLHDQSASSLHALPHAQLQEHNVGQVHPVHPVHPNQDARFARFARAVLTVPRVLTLGLARKAPGAPGAQPPIWPTSLFSAQAKHGHANICQVNKKAYEGIQFTYLQLSSYLRCVFHENSIHVSARQLGDEKPAFLASKCRPAPQRHASKDFRGAGFRMLQRM